MKQFILLLLITSTNLMFAQSKDPIGLNSNIENGIAIQGYDAVAYFNKQAVKGSKKFRANHRGIIYHFSSEANKQAFLKNPGKYEPMYGGWCAYAMGDSGDKVSIDPETFKIIDGKLYLFYNAYFNNTLNSWNKDEKNLKNKANTNWSNTLKK